jgi:hypothetical protein
MFSAGFNEKTINVELFVKVNHIIHDENNSRRFQKTPKGNL